MTDYWAKLLYFFESGLYVRVGLVISFGFLLLFGFRLQRQTNRIDFSYLILNQDGKVDAKKMFELGAFVVSTWAFCYLTLDGKLAEWYFTAYMLTWTGNQLINKWLAKDSPPFPTPSQVVVETTVDGQSVKVG